MNAVVQQNCGSLAKLIQTIAKQTEKKCFRFSAIATTKTSENFGTNCMKASQTILNACGNKYWFL